MTPVVIRSDIVNLVTATPRTTGGIVSIFATTREQAYIQRLPEVLVALGILETANIIEFIAGFWHLKT